MILNMDKIQFENRAEIGAIMRKSSMITVMDFALRKARNKRY